MALLLKKSRVEEAMCTITVEAGMVTVMLQGLLYTIPTPVYTSGVLPVPGEG